MKQHYRFDLRQLLSLATVFFFAPALRLVPSATAEIAGRAAWVSVLAAFPPVLLYLFFLRCFLRCRREGEGLAELILRSLGKLPGSLVLLLFFFWFLIYGGFMLRSGAIRIITAIYPKSSPSFFIVSMGLLCLYASLGSEQCLVRTAKIIRPFLLGMLILVLFSGFFSIDRDNLLPLTVFDCAGCLKASLASLGVCSVSIYSCFFLHGLSQEEKGLFRSMALWAVMLLLLLFWLISVIQGSFGYELTVMLSQPFFALVRNLVFFRSLERVEALVVSLWIFSDFVLVSLCLHSAQHVLRLVSGYNGSFQGQSTFSLSDGRWLIWLCAILLILFSSLIASDPPSMVVWSRQVIPGLNFFFSLIVLPLVFITGKIRQTI